MATIRVKCGCGITYRDGNGVERHALKTPDDRPFECDDAQADRLVKLGVADYVNDLGWRAVADPAPVPESSQEPEKRMGHLDAKDLETWDFNELKKLAADMGVVPNGKKKADYIAAIVEVEVELGPEVDPEDLDDLPDLSTAEPE